MQINKVITGDNLMLFDSSKKSLAFATNHTLTITTSTSEINCKDAGVWGSTIVNKMNWEITSENLFSIEGYNSLFDKMVARQAVTVYFGVPDEYMPTSGSSAQTITEAVKESGIDSPSAAWMTSASSGSSMVYKGTAYITNLTVNAQSGDNASYTVTLGGADAITRLYPTA